MNECYGKKFILNGVLQTAELFDNSLVYDGDSIYEVIRMVKGSPVFFNDHMERLATSVKLQHKAHLADVPALRKDIIYLTRSDRKKETNLKIVFNYNNGSSNYLVYFIEPIYPSDEQYKKGVKGILFSAERKNPESKVINHKLRSSIYHRLILDGGYEALLVNENSLITEGSRSNIFFLKGETLVTAPDSVILNGITRKHILEICMENQIKVEFACVKVADIIKYDAIFMTGTSPLVLPFYCINDKFFNVRHPLIQKLRQLYMAKVEESVRLFRHE
ncbi:MAG: aminotransferase class IV [Bacteroidia bacterium]|nr:aminotransferase class IV [Bacteroidia bacterium]